MGDCENYGPFSGPYYNTGPNTGPYLRDPKRDHNFDNPPYTCKGTALPGAFQHLGSSSMRPHRNEDCMRGIGLSPKPLFLETAVGDSSKGEFHNHPCASES